MDRMNISIAARAIGGTINKDAEFTSVCIDNRAVVEGCLFFAIKGENFNGHLFVKKALEAGAA
ncbi:MAG: UDP-N-acetylmuramoyl-tripeptide--D-alanyl-D-alanine ligase, partial [Clostridia bacterium]|nr:UDP-N-acetylmuramoyl-tripeptide--D-alanyl-D-alanine ligase [Clostridia bacterium]